MAENYRTQISILLTKTLVLFGRLHPESNPEQLPHTLSQLLALVQDLKKLEQSGKDFPKILKDSIELRHNYSEVFAIPPNLVREPTIQGIYAALRTLVDPLVVPYCENQRKLLSPSGRVSPARREALLKTREHCTLLSAYCSHGNITALKTLQDWCETELDKLS